MAIKARLDNPPHVFLTLELLFEQDLQAASADCSVKVHLVSLPESHTPGTQLEFPSNHIANAGHSG